MHKLIIAPTTLPDTPPAEYIAAAAAAGFDGVGLRLYKSPILPFHPVVGDATLIRAMKDGLANGGLTVLDILSFYLQPETRVDDFAPALDLGAEFGARYALVIADDPDWVRMTENFGRFCDIAGRNGLTAALEIAALRQVSSLKQGIRLIDGAGRANAVICLDPLNLVRAGETAADLKLLPPKLMPYAQISDGIVRGEKAERRLPGEGELPLRDILAALPPGLPLSVEVPPPPGVKVKAAEWAREVADKTRAYLARR